MYVQLSFSDFVSFPFLSFVIVVVVVERWDADTPLRCVIGNLAAKDAANVHLHKASVQMSQVVGKKVVATADWTALTTTSSFTSLKDVEQRKKIMAVAAQGVAFAKVVQEVSEHPIGKAALVQRLRRVQFVEGPDESGERAGYALAPANANANANADAKANANANANDDDDSKVFTISLSTSTMDQKEKNRVTALRLRWHLQVLLDFEKATGDARVQKQTVEQRTNFKSEQFTTHIDWGFQTQPLFLELEPEAQSRICNSLSGVCSADFI